MNKLLAIFLLFIVAGCSNAPINVSHSQAPSGNKKLLVDQYYIGVDDLVEVNVWKHQDLSTKVPVRPDGKISVPLIGEVLAGGKTPEEVSAEITKRLSTYIRQPNVSVILVELRSHEFLSRVRVTGAVRSQLSIKYRQGMTVLDIVLQAGGVNEFAAPNRTKLFRKEKGQIVTIDIALDDILNDGDMSTNYAIQPGDTISVPERVF